MFGRRNNPAAGPAARGSPPGPSPSRYKASPDASSAGGNTGNAGRSNPSSARPTADAPKPPRRGRLCDRVCRAVARQRLFARQFAHGTRRGRGGKQAIGPQRLADLARPRFRGFPAGRILRRAARRQFRLGHRKMNACASGMSISIRSPSCTRPITPPDAASGETWPIDSPEVPPENRPSVNKAQAFPSPFDFR